MTLGDYRDSKDKLDECMLHRKPLRYEMHESYKNKQVRTEIGEYKYREDGSCTLSVREFYDSDPEDTVSTMVIEISPDGRYLSGRMEGAQQKTDKQKWSESETRYIKDIEYDQHNHIVKEKKNIYCKGELKQTEEHVFTNEYDERGSLTKQTRNYDGSVGESTYQNTYGDDGRLTDSICTVCYVTRDAAGPVTKIHYTYDRYGFLLSETSEEDDEYTRVTTCEYGFIE